MTSDGRSLKYKAKEVMKTTFSKGQRWEHIKEVARRTSYKVGPGCYNFPITTNKGKGPVIIKDQVVANPSNGNFDYIYVGDTLMKRERPTSRGGLSPRSYLYTSERNMSPTESRYGGNFGEVSGRNSMRAMSAGRNSAPRVDYQTGGDSPYSSARRIYPSYSNQNGGNSPNVQPKKKMPSYDYPIMRNTSHSPSRQYERQVSGGQSPGKYSGNMSPERRSNNNSARNLHDDERTQAKDKDFYAALQDQWNNNNQKIVIHRQGSGKRLDEDL